MCVRTFCYQTFHQYTSIKLDEMNIIGMLVLLHALPLQTLVGVSSGSAERSKRFVIYPYGGGYKLVIGISIPVMLPKYQSLGFASNVQFQYPQITNLTQIQQDLPPIINRRRRSREEKSERALTYMALEALMDKYGINGKVCLLRSICENAMHSLNHDANGLYGELIDIILTPDDESDDAESNIDSVYIDAKRAGEYGVDCLSLYPNCPLGHGLLDMISILEDV